MSDLRQCTDLCIVEIFVWVCLDRQGNYLFHSISDICTVLWRLTSKTLKNETSFFSVILTARDSFLSIDRQITNRDLRILNRRFHSPGVVQVTTMLLF